MHCVIGRQFCWRNLALLKDVFICNGYPKNLVLKTLNESWPKETLKVVLNGVEQQVEAVDNQGYF